MDINLFNESSDDFRCEFPDVCVPSDQFEETICIGCAFFRCGDNLIQFSHPSGQLFPEYVTEKWASSSKDKLSSTASLQVSKIGSGSK